MESSSVRRGSTPLPRCGRAAELPWLHMPDLKCSTLAINPCKELQHASAQAGPC